MIEKQYQKINELKKELPGKIATRAEDAEKLKKDLKDLELKFKKIIEKVMKVTRFLCNLYIFCKFLGSTFV